MKEKIAKWYRLGLWTRDMVHEAVGRVFGGVPFTEEDYREIVGEEV